MFKSIRYKVGLILFLSVFLLTTLVVSALQFQSYLRLEKSELRNSKSAIRAAMETTDKWILYKLNLVRNASYLMDKAIHSSSDLLADLKKFTKENSITSGIYMGFEDGKYLDSSDWIPGKGYDCRQRPWYKAAKKKSSAVFVTPYKDAMTGEDAVTFAAPLLYEGSTEVKAVVAFDVLLEELKQLISNIFRTDVDRLLSFYLPDGKFSMLIKTKEIDDVSAEALVRLFSEQGMPGNASRNINNEDFMIVHGQLSTVNSIIIYPVALSVLTQPILLQSIMYFVIAIAGVVFIMSLTWYVMGRHIRRIEALNQTAKEVAAGNFNIEVSRTSSDEIGELADSFNKMVRNLRKHIKTIEITVREKESIAKELDIAATIQEKAIPKEMPVFEGLDISASSIPAKAVGGDYYDFVFPCENKIGLVIADAVGKGISASLYMSNVRSAFRVFSLQEDSPAQMLMKVNEHVSRDTSLSDSMFITYNFLVFDKETKCITYSNAGHFPPLYYCRGENQFKDLNAGGMPIGIFNGQEYTEGSFEVCPGDVIVMFTDGIVEANSVDKKMFGEERLRDVVLENVDKSAENIICSINGSVDKFSGEADQFDDMTVVVIKVV